MDMILNLKFLISIPDSSKSIQRNSTINGCTNGAYVFNMLIKIVVGWEGSGELTRQYTTPIYHGSDSDSTFYFLWMVPIP